MEFVVVLTALKLHFKFNSHNSSQKYVTRDNPQKTLSTVLMGTIYFG